MELHVGTTLLIWLLIEAILAAFQYEHPKRMRIAAIAALILGTLQSISLFEPLTKIISAAYTYGIAILINTITVGVFYGLRLALSAAYKQVRA